MKEHSSFMWLRSEILQVRMGSPSRRQAQCVTTSCRCREWPLTKATEATVLHLPAQQQPAGMVTFQELAGREAQCTDSSMQRVAPDAGLSSITGRLLEGRLLSAQPALAVTGPASRHSHGQRA